MTNNSILGSFSQMAWGVRTKRRKEGREANRKGGHKFCYREICIHSIGIYFPLFFPSFLWSGWNPGSLDFRADGGQVAEWKEGQQGRHGCINMKDLDAEPPDSLFHPLRRHTHTSLLSPLHIKLSFSTVSNTEASGTKLCLAYWDCKTYNINERISDQRQSALKC